ncbi:MAG: ribosome small subunit-dependent GTPase A [Oligoflexia bacterium]|nr:ribosome small subunit-dependent GTPase A [Oligoflexia bacterium]
MCPKFKGDSEDWLDDEGDSVSAKARAAARKSSHARATPLAPEKANAVVAEVYPNQCRVKLLADDRELLCAFRRAGVLQKGEIRERSPVAVGDLVFVKELGTRHAEMDQGLVEGVCARSNRLYRPAPGREGTQIHHVIAANMDLVVIVASERDPDFSPGLVDRFLVAAQAARIDTLICATKCDLWSVDSPQRLAPPWKLYLELGFEIAEVSAKRGDGVAALRERLKGKKALFCGHSGVGKTSLLRALLGTELGRVGEVSQATGKGRHTTTATVLVGGPDGSQWMDSPGIREFGLADIDAEKLAEFFPELGRAGCAKTGCHHEGEEGCAAAATPRYSSFRRILQSLRSGEN